MSSRVMTVAVPALVTADAPRSAISFDSIWLVWIAIIAVLLSLVMSPFICLATTSATASALDLASSEMEEAANVLGGRGFVLHTPRRGANAAFSAPGC